MTKLKVLVLCFPYFMGISNIKTKLQHLFTLLQFKESCHINISYKLPQQLMKDILHTIPI
jgi:hypothetical protein